MSPERIVLYVSSGGLAAVMLTWAFLALQGETSSTQPPSAGTAAAETVPPPSPPAPLHPGPSAVPPPAGSATASTLAIADPEQTVATQVALLTANRDAEFRETFVPRVRAELTPDALEACKATVRSHPVRPDWEMAEVAWTEAGEPIRRVSMFGKSMTGFVQVAPAQWLADSVWCTQGRLP